MGAVRDSFPDRNRATGSLRPPSPDRMRLLRPSRIVPTMPSRPSTVSPNPEPKLSPPLLAPAGAPPLSRQPKLLDRLREALRARHYSPRTEQSYRHWVKRFIFFHHVRHPAEMAEPEVNAFLTHLAVKEKVSASTQNQALSALLFLYRHVLGRPIGDLGEVVRARRPKRLPVVLTRQEVKAVLGNLTGDKWLMASLVHGAGLLECLRLRVQDVDIAAGQITVRDGKGFQDRRTMLPEAVKGPLEAHLVRVRQIHLRDLAEGYGRVARPYALARKYPKAAATWGWQWVFPQEQRWVNPSSGHQGRHHVDESLVQRAVQTAVRKSGIPKHATCHTFRHCFATHLLGSRLRHPDRAGTPRPQGCQDDHDLHPCAQPRRPGRPKPRGCLVGSGPAILG